MPPMHHPVRLLVVVAAILGIVACSSAPPDPNRPPDANAGPGLDAVVGETVELDGSESTDPDGDALAFTWILSERPEASVAALENADAEVATFTPDVEGAYRFTLTVSDGTASSTDEAPLAVAPAGVEQLEGDPDSPASNAVFDLHVPLRAASEHIEFDADLGAEVLRTEIEIEFVDDVTVERVNRILQSIEGRIVSMVRNAPIVIVAADDPGDLPSLDAIVERVEAEEAVASAAKSVVSEAPRSFAEPGDARVGTNAVPSLAAPSRIDHQIAVRGHAAWNVRSALPPLPDRPTLLVADFFGDGPPQDGYDIRSTADHFGDDLSNRHGYHVLGIATGAYGSGASSALRSDVTGLFPGTLDVAAVDINDGTLTANRTRNLLVQRMNDIVAADPGARIVVNTSLGNWDPNAPLSSVNRPARKYIKQIRNNDLEDRVVHVTSAGNAGGSAASPVRWPAAFNSEFAYAALGIVIRVNGPRIDNLRNVLVVENRVNTPEATTQRPTPGCANGRSIMGGQLSAIGTQVWSFGQTLSDGAGNVVGSDSGSASSASGTSMAAPQVAALAAYVWALDPTLDAPAVVDLLIRTARDDYDDTLLGNGDPAWGCNATAPSPVIDAFDAVLAAGGSAARIALGDVVDASGNPSSDGVFDEHDVAALYGAWQGGPALTYSRLDLNGDGEVGGLTVLPGTDRMDANGDGVFETITVDRLGASVTLDETALTDLDVLCLLAFGPAYAGDAFERNRLLGQPCGLIDVDIVDPTHGAAFVEGDEIGVWVDAAIGAPHDGDVVLLAGGAERDRHRGYGYLDDFTIGTLSTRRLCPSDPTLHVVFQDSATGLRATDVVSVLLEPAPLSVSVAGASTRWVRLKRDTTTGEVFHDDITLEGSAHLPTCSDPNSERIDASSLAWVHQSVLGYGPSLTLREDFLYDPTYDSFGSRKVSLSYERDGESAEDDVSLKPCSSSLGLPPEVGRVDGFRECPIDGVIGSIIDSLAGAFGTVDPADTEEIVGLILHGHPQHRDVLERLGSEPCDPRVCDPYPPNFPMSEEDLSSSYYGDRGLTTTAFLDGLFDALAVATLPEFDARLETLLLEVGASTDISQGDRALIAASASVALGVVDEFAPEAYGGRNRWRSLGFAGDPDTLVDRVDVLEPATKGVQGFLTAVVIDGASTDYAEGSLHIDAAAYAASLAAYQEARKAARE